MDPLTNYYYKIFYISWNYSSEKSEWSIFLILRLKCPGMTSTKPFFLGELLNNNNTSFILGNMRNIKFSYQINITLSLFWQLIVY